MSTVVKMLMLVMVSIAFACGNQTSGLSEDDNPNMVDCQLTKIGIEKYSSDIREKLAADEAYLAWTKELGEDVTLGEVHVVPYSWEQRCYKDKAATLNLKLLVVQTAKKSEKNTGQFIRRVIFTSDEKIIFSEADLTKGKITELSQRSEAIDVEKDLSEIAVSLYKLDARSFNSHNRLIKTFGKDGTSEDYKSVDVNLGNESEKTYLVYKCAFVTESIKEKGVEILMQYNAKLIVFKQDDKERWYPEVSNLDF